MAKRIVKLAKTKSMMVIDIGDGKEVWANTSKKVIEYAKKVLKLGDNNAVLEEVDFEYTEQNGQFFVTRIAKGGAPAENTYQQSKNTQEPAQTKTEEPPKSTGTSVVNNVVNSSDVAEALNNVAVGLVIVGLTGQVDPNNVGALIKAIKAELKK